MDEPLIRFMGRPQKVAAIAALTRKKASVPTTPWWLWIALSSERPMSLMRNGATSHPSPPFHVVPGIPNLARPWDARALAIQRSFSVSVAGRPSSGIALSLLYV